MNDRTAIVTNAGRVLKLNMTRPTGYRFVCQQIRKQNANVISSTCHRLWTAADGVGGFGGAGVP
ncbi:MAG TPA: hypothetical protein VNH18_18200, partial [Bryobacteraceae bacterium]|nr:hypothetical protein [Bryobacteraceae bacterium]